MANQWFKFYGAEYLSDPKMDRLSVQERSCWLTLLCMASQTNGVVKYLSVEGLLTKSGIRFNPYDDLEWDNAKNVLNNFESYEMIVVHDDGSVELKNWHKRQDSALTPYERVKKHRENKRIVANDNEMITGDNGNDNGRIEENRIEENRIEENRIEENRIEEIEKPTQKSNKFIKPTFEEVRSYCEERKNGIDPQKFIDTNDGKGWLVGTTKTPMKDWRAVIRTWEGFQRDNKPANVLTTKHSKTLVEKLQARADKNKNI